MEQASSSSGVTSTPNAEEALKFPIAATPGTKEEPKKEPTQNELLLEWTVYHLKNDSETKVVISADDMIAQGKSLAETRAVQQETGEVGERCFVLKLVNHQEKKELGFLCFDWWDDSSKANLMNFNIHSQDLADFCRELWLAAGRRRNQYCDMAIEFGRSPHSSVEVNGLIAETFGSMDEETMETTYLDLGNSNVQACQTTEQGLRLVNGLISLVGKQSTLITYESDLSKLHVIGHEAHGNLRWETLGSTKWYVRTADDR
jgi:hypothetical protein